MPRVEMVELCMDPEVWELVGASLKRHHPRIEFFDLPSVAGVRSVGIRPVNSTVPAPNPRRPVSASPESPQGEGSKK